MKRTSDPATREHARSIAHVLSDDANLLIIKTFVIAARYMSFKAAARHLCLTPGAVSHRIARLEQVLGFPLFNRLTRSVTLTVEGERLRAVYESALVRIKAECDATEDKKERSRLERAQKMVERMLERTKDPVKYAKSVKERSERAQKAKDKKDPREPGEKRERK